MELHELAEKLFGFRLHQKAHQQIRDHFIPHEGNNHKPHVVHHRALFLYSAFLVLAKVTVLTLPLILPSAAQSLAITPENIMSLTNQTREEYGLRPLLFSPKLALAAERKAQDMMEKGYFAHYSPEGISPWYWILDSGYNYYFAGENLAIRFATAEGVNEAWLASAAHRANILSKDFTDIGVAVLTGNFGGEGIVTLVVQMFGSRTAETGVGEDSKTYTKQILALPKADSVLPSVKSGSLLDPPRITFPLDNSFVNQAAFKILGRAASAELVQLFVDSQLYGEASVLSTGEFEYLIPEQLSLADGSHSLYAVSIAGPERTSPKSEEINFRVDTQPPEIFADKFEISPALGNPNVFDVKAFVAADSVRTIVLAGKDSAVLERLSDTGWVGQITLYNISSNQLLPVEVFAQDLAGNQNTRRVGTLQVGNVAGVFNFLKTEEQNNSSMSLLGGLLTFENFKNFVNSLYLYFVVFLAFALLLKIVIKRHIQHPKTIAGSALVIMLAMVLFTV